MAGELRTEHGSNFVKYAGASGAYLEVADGTDNLKLVASGILLNGVPFSPGGGSTGIQGVTGPSGGEKGSTGVQGITGPSGGEKGATGAQGFTGINGAIGATGSQGITGLRGDTGLQGVTGPSGIGGGGGVTGQGTAGTVPLFTEQHSIGNSVITQAVLSGATDLVTISDAQVSIKTSQDYPGLLVTSLDDLESYQVVNSTSSGIHNEIHGGTGVQVNTNLSQNGYNVWENVQGASGIANWVRNVLAPGGTSSGSITEALTTNTLYSGSPGHQLNLNYNPDGTSAQVYTDYSSQGAVQSLATAAEDMGGIYNRIITSNGKSIITRSDYSVVSYNGFSLDMQNASIIDGFGHTGTAGQVLGITGPSGKLVWIAAGSGSGAQGTTGIQGTTGVSIQGVTGLSGPQGVTGPSGIGGGVTGVGTSGKLSKWTTASSVGDSVIAESASGTVSVPLVASGDTLTIGGGTYKTMSGSANIRGISSDVRLRVTANTSYVPKALEIANYLSVDSGATISTSTIAGQEFGIFRRGSAAEGIADQGTVSSYMIANAISYGHVTDHASDSATTANLHGLALAPFLMHGEVTTHSVIRAFAKQGTVVPTNDFFIYSDYAAESRFAGALNPVNDNSHTLGTSSLRWSGLYNTFVDTAGYAKISGALLGSNGATGAVSQVLTKQADGTQLWATPSSGGGGYTVVPVTSGYTATQTSGTIIFACDSTSSNNTVYLPTASGNSATFIAKKKVGANSVIVDGFNSETLDGYTTSTLTALNESKTFVSDGTNWLVL